MNFLATDDGRVRCTGIELLAADSRSPVTGTAIRQIPVETYARRASGFVALEAVEQADGSFDFSRNERGAIEAFERVYQASRRPQRGVPLSDEHLQGVANVYRKALEAHKPPTKEVMLQCHTSRSNAARWVAEARKRHFLGPTTERHGGELPVDASKEQTHGKEEQ